MDEIAELQRQLAQVQRSSASGAARLSERNCVELVSKLCDLQLIDVVFTQSGRKYVTRERLRSDVLRELEAHHGRVNVVQLAALLSVDLPPVQREVDAILSAQPPHAAELRLLNGEILSEAYFDSVAESIAAALDDSGVGSIALAELATRYRLPIDEISAVVNSRIARGVISGRVENMQLYTAVYLVRTQARVRGMLHATMTPVTVSEIALTLEVAEHTAFEAVNALMCAGNGEQGGDNSPPPPPPPPPQGSLRGRGASAVYTPSSFQKLRERAVESYFRAHEYIDNERLRELSFSDAQGRKLLGQLSDAVLLRDGAISASLLHRVGDAMGAAAAAGSWLDFTLLLPAALPAKDTAEVIARALRTSASEEQSAGGEPPPAAAAQTDVHVLGERFAVSGALLERCRAVFRTDAERRAEESVRRHAAASSMATVAAASPGAAAAAAAAPGADGDGGGAAGGGKARSKKEQRRRAKTRPADDEPPAVATKSAPSAAADALAPQSAPEACRMLATLPEKHASLRTALHTDYAGEYDGVDDGDDDALEGSLTMAVAVRLAGELGAMYSAALSDAERRIKREREELSARRERELLQRLQRIELLDDSCEACRSAAWPREIYALARRHVAEAELPEALNAVLRCLSLGGESDTPPPAIESFPAAAQPLLRPLQRAVSAPVTASVPPIKLPPGGSSVAAIAALAAAGAAKEDGDDAASGAAFELEEKPSPARVFLHGYDDVAVKLALPPRQPLERKRERQALVSALRADCVRSLQQSTALMEALTLAAELSYARRQSGVWLPMSPECAFYVAAAVTQRRRRRAPGGNDHKAAAADEVAFLRAHELLLTRGKDATPRELAGMDARNDDESAAALAALVDAFQPATQ